MRRIEDTVSANIHYFLSFYILLLLLRITEYLLVDFVGEEAPGILHLLSGMFLDLLLAASLSACSVILQLILGLTGLKKQVVLPLIALCVLIASASLTVFFWKAKMPLDESVFLFTWDEIVTIANLGENATFGNVSLLILFVLLFFLLALFIKKKWAAVKIERYLLFLMVLAIPLSPLCYFSSENKTTTVFVNNRLIYFLGRSYAYFDDNGEFSVFGEDVALNDINGLDPDFLHGQKEPDSYPLMHDLKENVAFDQYFNYSEEGLPNIVLIIVESLSSDFVGERASSTGNFMPFLDSLTHHSLYFPNLLSTCQRTFNVLPATLSSIPNSTNGIFTTNEKYTPHFSLPFLLDKDYFSRFYCGVRLNYNHMDAYMSNLNIDHLVGNWDEKYKRKFSERKNTWGYPDGFLFEKSWEDYDVQQLGNKPRLDIFLTISTHDPFSFPDDSRYIRKSKKKRRSRKIPAEIKEQLLRDEYVMASFAYTDDALRAYFHKARTKPGFEKTIFLITGDHGSPFYGRNQMSKYHVPLLIYSPLLKRSGAFHAVSSHLDIAPTLIAYLKSQYELDLPDQVSFMGSELDMHKAFRCRRSLALLATNGINESLVQHQWAMVNGQLFTLSEGLELSEVRDDERLSRMVEQLGKYENLSRYCFQNDRIVPPEMYDRYNSKKGKRTIIHADQQYKFIGHKLHDFKKVNRNDTLIPLMPDFTLDPKARSVKIVCYADIYLDRESQLDSIARVQLTGTNIYEVREGRVFAVPALPRLTEKFKPGDYNRLRFEKEIDLEKYKRLKKNNRISLGILNPEQQELGLGKVKVLMYYY